MAKVPSTQAVEMIYQDGKIYMESESLTKWLEDSSLLPDLQRFAKLLRNQAHMLKLQVEKPMKV